MRGCGLDSCGLGQVLVSGSCEHGNKPSGSIKYREVLDRLSIRFLRETQIHAVSHSRYYSNTGNICNHRFQPKRQLVLMFRSLWSEL
jgi:hypothetical protein